MPMTLFKNEVFSIETFKPNDANSLNAMMLKNTLRFKRYFPLTLNSNDTLQKSKDYIELKNIEIAAQEQFTYAIKDAITTDVIGVIIIKEVDWDIAQGELAYCMDESYGGKGIMTKTVKEISRYALDELGFKRLQIIVHKSNLPSLTVAEKSAYLWQRTLPNEYTPPNEEPLDMELYELIKELK